MASSSALSVADIDVCGVLDSSNGEKENCISVWRPINEHSSNFGLFLWKQSPISATLLSHILRDHQIWWHILSNALEIDLHSGSLTCSLSDAQECSTFNWASRIIADVSPSTAWLHCISWVPQHCCWHPGGDWHRLSVQQAACNGCFDGKSQAFENVPVAKKKWQNQRSQAGNQRFFAGTFR